MYKKQEFDDNLERFKKVSKICKHSLTLLRQHYDKAEPQLITKKIKDNTFNDIVNFQNNKDRMVSIKEYKDIEENYPIFILRNGVYFLVSDEFHYLSLKPKKCIIVKIETLSYWNSGHGW